MADPDPGAAWVEIELDVGIHRFFALGLGDTDDLLPDDIMPVALSTDGDCSRWRLVGPVDADRAKALNNRYPEQPSTGGPDEEEPDYEGVNNDWGGVVMTLEGTLRCAVLSDSISEVDEGGLFPSSLMPMRAIDAGNIENAVVTVADWM